MGEFSNKNNESIKLEEDVMIIDLLKQKLQNLKLEGILEENKSLVAGLEENYKSLQTQYSEIERVKNCLYNSNQEFLNAKDEVNKYQNLIECQRQTINNQRRNMVEDKSYIETQQVSVA